MLAVLGLAATLAAFTLIIPLLEQESPFFIRTIRWNPVFEEVLPIKEYFKFAFRVGNHLFVCLCAPSSLGITPNVNSLPVLKRLGGFGSLFRRGVVLPEKMKSYVCVDNRII